MIADFTGIEFRVLAWIAGEHNKLDMWSKFDRTGDPHDDPYFVLGRQCGIAEADARKIRQDCRPGIRVSWAACRRGGASPPRVMLPTTRRSNAIARPGAPRIPRPSNSGTRSIARRSPPLRRPGTDFQLNELGRLLFCFEEPFLRITLPSGRSLSYPFARIDGVDKFGRPKVTFRDNAGGKFVECRFGQGAWPGFGPRTSRRRSPAICSPRR